MEEQKEESRRSQSKKELEGMDRLCFFFLNTLKQYILHQNQALVIVVLLHLTQFEIKCRINTKAQEIKVKVKSRAERKRKTS